MISANLSSKHLPSLDHPEVVRDAKSAELKDERLEGRVRLVVEDRVLDSRTRPFGFVLVQLFLLGQDVEEGGHVGSFAIIDQRDRRVVFEILKSNFDLLNQIGGRVK